MNYNEAHENGEVHVCGNVFGDRYPVYVSFPSFLPSSSPSSFLYILPSNDEQFQPSFFSKNIQELFIFYQTQSKYVLVPK